MAKFKPQTWTIDITVDPIWIRDGFDLAYDNEDMVEADLELAIMGQFLPHAYEGEVKCKVTKRPNPDTLKAIADYDGDL